MSTTAAWERICLSLSWWESRARAAFKIYSLSCWQRSKWMSTWSAGNTIDLVKSTGLDYRLWTLNQSILHSLNPLSWSLIAKNKWDKVLFIIRTNAYCQDTWPDVSLFLFLCLSHMWVHQVYNICVVPLSRFCTCKPSTKGLLHSLFLQFASSQADQLGPNCQHGLSERQVLHTEGYRRHLKERTTKEENQYFIVEMNLFKVKLELMC